MKTLVDGGKSSQQSESAVRVSSQRSAVGGDYSFVQDYDQMDRKLNHEKADQYAGIIEPIKAVGWILGKD